MARVLSLRFPHLALVAAWRRHPELRGEPVVVGGAPELRLPVLAASEAAVAAGVRPGLPLREAQQRCPAAAFVAVDEEAVAALRRAALDALQGEAPAVEIGDESALCDISGRHIAHDGEAAWAASVGRALAAALDEDAIAVGVAGSRLVAAIAAGRAGARRIRRVPPGGDAAFLAPLPLAVLDLDPAVSSRLAALGLDCVGAVAALSAADLQRQFGPYGQEVRRRARAEDGAAVRAESAPRCWSERLALDGAVADLEALRFAVHRCAMGLGERLRAQACVATVVRLRCELEDAPAVERLLTPAEPAGSGRELWTAALGLLGGIQLAAPVTAVRLEVESPRPGPGRQVDLWRRGDASREALAGEAQRLRARLGGVAIRRPALEVDPGDLPERRFRWEEVAPVVVERPAAGRRR